MSRRHSAEKREILPDAKFQDKVLAKFMNHLMEDGKKSVAEKIVYGALDIVHENLKQPPVDIFHQVVEEVAPEVEVKSRRVGGATYQVPMEVAPGRARTLAMKWIISAARRRAEKTMRERLAGELMDAYNKRGQALKKRDETHKMAEANRAFAHFRF